MAIIATETPRTSAVIKHQYDPSSGYTNELVSVTIPAGGMKLGTVLDNAGAVIAVAGTANAAYVVVDPEIANKPAVPLRCYALPVAQLFWMPPNLCLVLMLMMQPRKMPFLLFCKARVF